MNLAGGLPLQLVQDVPGGILLALHVVLRKIMGDFVGADRFLQIGEHAIGHLFLKLIRSLDDVREGRIGPARPMLEFEEQVAAGRRGHFKDRPDEDKGDEKSFPKMAAVHEDLG